MATTDSSNQNGSVKSSSLPVARQAEVVDDAGEDSPPEAEESTSATPHPVKHPIHRVNAPGSVQAIAVDDDVLFTGTQGGHIVVWSLETYELLATVPAHEESVLSLALSEDRSLLFSTGADSIVNVWSTESLERLYSLISQFEIGDIFCAVHSAKIQTLFWGAQNSSVQWYKLSTDAAVRSPVSAPGPRKHRFFDSLGPGGTSNELLDEEVTSSTLGGRALTVPSRNYLPYAHKSYIYSILLVKGLSTNDKDEEILVTGGGDGMIKLWSIDKISSSRPMQIAKLKTMDLNVLSLAYRGSFLCAGLSDGFAYIYSLASRQLVQKLQVGHGDIIQILVSTKSILCGTSEGWVKV